MCRIPLKFFMYRKQVKGHLKRSRCLFISFHLKFTVHMNWYTRTLWLKLTARSTVQAWQFIQLSRMHATPPTCISIYCFPTECTYYHILIYGTGLLHKSFRSPGQDTASLTTVWVLSELRRASGDCVQIWPFTLLTFPYIMRLNPVLFPKAVQSVLGNDAQQSYNQINCCCYSNRCTSNTVIVLIKVGWSLPNFFVSADTMQS